MADSWKRSPRTLKGLALATGSLLFTVGCAHVKTATEHPALHLASDVRVGTVPPRTVAEVIQSSPGKPTHSVNYGELSVQGVKLKNTQFDYPITINSRVEYWVNYFTGRGRPFFEKYLERSEYFIPYIEPLLKQNGMPSDLVYLAMIESGFNNHARSFAKAVGPWQFMSATGKRYGLMVNWWVDERRDIRKSTLAAVEYLRDLHGMFQSWELAAAAYNAGENKIARAIQRYGTKDFWVISRQRFLRAETRDYVPKIIAAALISKNRDLFGFKPSVVRPNSDEAVAGDGELVKVIKTDKPEEKLDPAQEMRDLGLTAQTAAPVDDEDSDDDDDATDGRAITPASLLVNADPGTESGQVEQPLAKPVPTPHVNKDGQVGGDQLVEFDIKSPADLLKIARAAGLSYMTVKSLNPELLRWCTPPTLSTFRLKLPASTKEKFLSTYNHSAYPRQVQFMSYKVHKGETLTQVARHFGIQVDPMSDLNGVSARMPLRSGVRVLLPIPNDRSRSLASLDLKDPPSKRRGSKRRSHKYYKITYKQRRESARTGERRRDHS